jgi:hypothetical protein
VRQREESICGLMNVHRPERLPKGNKVKHRIWSLSKAEPKLEDEFTSSSAHAETPPSKVAEVRERACSDDSRTRGFLASCASPTQNSTASQQIPGLLDSPADTARARVPSRTLHHRRSLRIIHSRASFLRPDKQLLYQQPGSCRGRQHTAPASRHPLPSLIPHHPAPTPVSSTALLCPRVILPVLYLYYCTTPPDT